MSALINASPLPRKNLIYYSFFALPMAFAGLPLYMHAPDFYMREMGFGMGAIGSILLAVRLIDAIQDPIIGYCSDRFLKHRLSIMFAGAVFLIFGLALLFAMPLFFTANFFSFTAGLILATTGFCMLSINLTTIGGFLHDDPHMRTIISAWREGFTLLGLLIAAILPTIFQNYMPAPEAYFYLFLIFLALSVTAMILFLRFSKTQNFAVSSVSDPGKFAFFSILWGPKKDFFILYFINVMAASLPSVLVLFFIQDYLDAKNLAGLFLVLYFLSGAAFIPLWARISKSLGRDRTWLISMILAVLTFIWAYFLQPGDISEYAIICILSGAALGADLALPPAILADRITSSQKEHEAAQHFAFLSILPKIALAVCSGGALLWLDHAGFVAGQSNTPQANQVLLMLYALVPCVIKSISALMLWGQIQKNENF